MSLQDKPELIIGIIGPIGVDLNTIIGKLCDALQNVDYKSTEIRLTNLMRTVPVGLGLREDTYVNKYNDLISYADAVRRECVSNAAMAGLAIAQIQVERDAITGRDPQSEAAAVPAYGHAFIVRQFKRREEIELMRETYGRKFVLISAYLSEAERVEEISRKIDQHDHTHRSRSEREELARSLVIRDKNERDNDYGQRVEEAFHLGDVFVPGRGDVDIKYTIDRFVNAFFGSNKITPNKYEYGMYAATGASLRSSDLSRQVGAAIFTTGGEIIALGCNEVPKPMGGTYWDERDSEPFRDIDRGFDANHKRKQKIVHDFVSRLAEVGILEGSNSPIDERVAQLLEHDAIKESQVLDIIEFGRMVHAEMNAITDAARLGRPLAESVLFCTTFPCHMCAKHIVSSGIKKVIFLESYPKSYAEDLHSDSITFDNQVENMVVFEPFTGISPRRYRDIFEKGKRKTSDGVATNWIEGVPLPRIEDRTNAYLNNEKFALKKSVASLLDTSGSAH